MKKYLLLLSLIVFSLISFSQEYIFKFKVNSKEEISKLTNIISIDNFKDGEVIAYANSKEFELFKTLNYKYKLLPHPAVGKSLTMATTVAEMANWDRYPTHDVYIQMMNNFAADYPTLCQLITIGTSEEGRPVMAVKISDNVSTHEAEPEFFYTGTMHGDETAGFVLLLRLIDYLLSGYGSDSRITNIINNFEIYINPASNPDGTYSGGNNTVSGATRSNSNGVDLNRNFPSPLLPNPSGMNQAEIQMMINFAEAHNFVFSTNTHGGIEVLNFPWDTWESTEKTHPDHNWLYHVCRKYADTVHIYSPSTYLDAYDNGVTHGGDWYVVNGSRQDHMTYYQHCREITLELSNTKLLDVENLPAHWNYNRSSFLGFIEECIYGFNGTVKNTSNEPLNAMIYITGHEEDSSEVYTDSENGDYYRPIEPGTYNVSYSSEGYLSQTHSVTVTDWETTTVLDVILLQAELVTVTGTVTEQVSGNPLENVKIEFLGSSIQPVYTVSNGTYSVTEVYEGTHQIKASKPGFTSIIQTVDITSANTVVDFSLEISNAISFENDIPTFFTFSGNADWIRVTPEAYDGEYSMRSGDISHNQSSVMETELEILSAGNISFYKKVSSESGWDFLRFYIDDIEQDEWSGEIDWSQETYSVSAGLHTFKWSFEKDGSVSNGEDCAWVDYIELPDYFVPGTYVVTFNVTDGTNALQNATVSFNSQNINTNVSGQAVFNNVDAGSDLPWVVSKYGYNTENGNLTITDQDVTQDVILTEENSFSVTFNITDGSNPIEDANINFNSEDILTDSNGTAVFENVFPGSGLPYIITKSGFNTFNGTLSVVDQDIIQDIILTEEVSVDVILSLSKIIISPNPFSNNAVIEFNIDNRSNVFAAIYSYTGELINVLLNNELEKGNHKLIWNGTNSSGGRSSNGIYFCKIISNNTSQSEKIMLVK